MKTILLNGSEDTKKQLQFIAEYDVKDIKEKANLSRTFRRLVEKEFKKLSTVEVCKK